MELSEEIPLDVCQTCGFKVWGTKMYNAIVQNMSDARDSGHLYQGSVTETPKETKPQKPIHGKTTTSFSSSFVQEAVSTSADIEYQKTRDLARIEEIQQQTGIDPDKEIISL